ncbi:MAG: hypothetical protein V1725_06185 [archaeon]
MAIVKTEQLACSVLRAEGLARHRSKSRGLALFAIHIIYRAINGTT